MIRTQAGKRLFGMVRNITTRAYPVVEISPEFLGEQILAIEAEAAHIDVMRLADALLAWTGATPLSPTFKVTASPNEMARAIAREYNRAP